MLYINKDYHSWNVSNSIYLKFHSYPPVLHVFTDERVQRVAAEDPLGVAYNVKVAQVAYVSKQNIKAQSHPI